MSNVLKVKVAGQRIKYEVMKVTFSESDLQAAKGWKWVKKGNNLCCGEAKSRRALRSAKGTFREC